MQNSFDPSSLRERSRVTTTIRVLDPTFATPVAGPPQSGACSDICTTALIAAPDVSGPATTCICRINVDADNYQMVHDPEMAHLLEDFAAEHPDAVIRHGGEIFVAAEAVTALIDEAEQRGVGILGMEGFLIDGEDDYPSLDRIADFSASSGSPRSVAESAALAREVLFGAWRVPPRPADQMHPRATGRHMIAVVADSPID